MVCARIRLFRAKYCMWANHALSGEIWYVRESWSFGRNMVCALRKLSSFRRNTECARIMLFRAKYFIENLGWHEVKIIIPPCGQRSVTAAWANRSPWSIFGNFYFFTKKADFRLFRASVRSWPPGPPEVPGVFIQLSSWSLWFTLTFFCNSAHSEFKNVFQYSRD